MIEPWHWKQISELNTSKPQPELSLRPRYGVKGGLERRAHHHFCHAPLLRTSILRAGTSPICSLDSSACGKDSGVSPYLHNRLIFFHPLTGFYWPRSQMATDGPLKVWREKGGTEDGRILVLEENLRPWPKSRQRVKGKRSHWHAWDVLNCYKEELSAGKQRNPLC